MSKIDVRYTCDGCGIIDRIVIVTERKPGELIGDWMDHMRHALARDHRAMSPNCLATEIKQVKIPMSGRRNIGGPVEH